MRLDKLSTPLPQNGTRIEGLRREIDRLFGFCGEKPVVVHRERSLRHHIRAHRTIS
jgi:hypothetical protein